MYSTLTNFSIPDSTMLDWNHWTNFELSELFVAEQVQRFVNRKCMQQWILCLNFDRMSIEPPDLTFWDHLRRSQIFSIHSIHSMCQEQPPTKTNAVIKMLSI